MNFGSTHASALAMSSNQPDCLTSLISYVPDLHIDLDFPATTDLYQPKAFPSSRQAKQQVAVFPEHLEVVSAQASRKHEDEFQSTNSLQPLRSALKKQSLKLPDKSEEESKCTGVNRELEQVSTTKQAVEADTNKPELVPARLLHKKKTVAFGRTVNVSQTIEGTSRGNRKYLGGSNFLKSKSHKMITDEQKNLKHEIEKLKEKVHQMEVKMEEFTVKDMERSDQFLKLTDMMKKLLDGGIGMENKCSRSKRSRSGKHSARKSKDTKYYRGKENIPPDTPYIEDMSSEADGDTPEATVHQETFRKNPNGRSSNDELKWAIMKRKYTENKEFKRLVDEAIMKYGGDESLEIFSSRHHEGDARRTPSGQREKLHCVSSSPVIRSTTRVMKQMTVEQFHGPKDSPTRSVAFSYDSKKYLARHGIIPALSDDDEVEDKTSSGKQQKPSLQSNYHPGNSITYYSKYDKYNSPNQKYDKYLDLVKDHPPKCGDQAGWQCRSKKKSSPLLDETNYQVDDFDTDENDSLDDIIEISDDSEDGAPFAATRIKMRSPHGAQAWRDSPHNNFRYKRNQDSHRCTKQRLNKSAWS